MKKLMCVVLVVVMMLSLVACGKKLSGTYEAEIDVVLLKYTATYEFSGSKVTAVKKTTVFGTVNTVTLEGTYEIAENDDGELEITFTFENEEEAKDYAGTFSFAKGKEGDTQYIKIGGAKYKKVD